MDLLLRAFDCPSFVPPKNWGRKIVGKKMNEKRVPPQNIFLPSILLP
jgi:hypothetical protein